jgi:hypothetical protein
MPLSFNISMIIFALLLNNVISIRWMDFKSEDNLGINENIIDHELPIDDNLRNLLDMNFLDEIKDRSEEDDSFEMDESFGRIREGFDKNLLENLDNQDSPITKTEPLTLNITFPCQNKVKTCSVMTCDEEHVLSCLTFCQNCRCQCCPKPHPLDCLLDQTVRCQWINGCRECNCVCKPPVVPTCDSGFRPKVIYTQSGCKSYKCCKVPRCKTGSPKLTGNVDMDQCPIVKC